LGEILHSPVKTASTKWQKLVRVLQRQERMQWKKPFDSSHPMQGENLYFIVFGVGILISRP
jgi:hypothetical protein